jgi:hypothetical protein
VAGRKKTTALSRVEREASVVRDAPKADVSASPSQNTALAAIENRLGKSDPETLAELVRIRGVLLDQDATARDRDAQTTALAVREEDKIVGNRHRRRMALFKAIQTPAYFVSSLATGVYLIQTGFQREGLFLLAGALSMTIAWRFVKRWMGADNGVE